MTATSEAQTEDVTPAHSANEVFTLSSYLTLPATTGDNLEPPPVATTLYGLDIPKEAAANLCSGCLGARDEELEDQPVLLCDGPNCGREYHLACCIPSLSVVPDGDHWLCQDCCPEGRTASLIQYLEAADKIGLPRDAHREITVCAGHAKLTLTTRQLRVQRRG